MFGNIFFGKLSESISIKPVLGSEEEITTDNQILREKKSVKKVFIYLFLIIIAIIVVYTIS